MYLLTLALLITADASASNTADEAEVNFQLGASAYGRGRFNQALFHFMLSNRLSPNRNVTFNIGRTYEALGALPEAFRWYQSALSSSADKTDDVARDITRAIDQLRPSVVTVRVESEPPGATVYVDRRDLGAVGTAPVEIALKPGAYTVLVEQDGYDPFQSEPLELRKVGQSQAVNAVLNPIVGTVIVTGAEGATVHVGTADAAAVCTMPCEVKLPEGQQILYFLQEGFRAQPSLVEVTRDQTIELTAELVPVTGTLIVDADERGALIHVDDRAVGYTPAVLTDIQVGERTVRVSLRGYDAYESTVQITEDGEVNLGRVSLTPRFTVTAASRSAQAVSEAPASVSLITSDEIRAFGYQTLYEALAGTRGFYQTNDLTYQSLGIRGFGRMGDYGNRVLTTMDGHVTNDDQIGSSYVSNDFITDLSDVQQIEVVRGPGSALYGSNAVFGVINLVTRNQEDTNATHATITTTDGLVRGKAGTGFGNDDIGGWISGGYTYGLGREYQFPEFAGRPRGDTSVGADSLRAQMLMGKAWAGDVQVLATYYGRIKQIPTGSFGTRLGDPRAHADDYRFFTEGKYAKTVNNTDVDIRLFFDSYWYNGAFPYGVNYVYLDDYLGMWAGVEPRVVQHIGDAVDLTVGLETRQHFYSLMESFESTDESNPGDQTLEERPVFQVYSAYAVADVHPGEVVRFNVGGRFDYYNTAVEPLSSFNPRAAVILKPGRETLKIMGGTAFRAPSPYEYFYNDGGISQLQPDSLDPETILTAEAEWTHAYSDVVSSTVGAYFNQIDRLIDAEPAGGGVFVLDNADDSVQTVGAEAELQRAWRGGWMVAGQGSWQRTRFTSFVDGEPLTNSPAWLGSVRGVVPLGGTTRLAQRLRLEAPRLTKDGSRTDPAVLMDVTLTGDIQRPNVAWGLGVRNLLDHREAHPGGADLRQQVLPQRGRDLYASVTASF